MTVKALDTLLAAKVINIAPGLRPSERQVALTLIEHFNRRTGRCDPGTQRIAQLLGCCTRTVIRATCRLEKAGLFEKVRHGGYSNRNSYRPNWTRFAELEAAWRKQLAARRSKCVTTVSVASGRASHVARDTDVTQTCSSNSYSKTFSGPPIKYRGAIGDRPQRQRSTEVARVEAERRWSNDLLRSYASEPLTYSEIVDLIDPDLQARATEAEINRRGSGIRLIQNCLKLPDV